MARPVLHSAACTVQQDRKRHFCYEWRDAVAAGGLMSYNADRDEVARQIGNYAARILKGAKPSDLPVVQSSKFVFTINLATAKALGLAISPALLARADEVIE